VAEEVLVILEERARVPATAFALIGFEPGEAAADARVVGWRTGAAEDEDR
jgi:hypothetical protein